MFSPDPSPRTPVISPPISSHSFSTVSTPSTASSIISQLPDPSAIRRRSVDTGGLALALRDSNSGKGWGGWGEREDGPIPYAEFLSKMYHQTMPLASLRPDVTPPPPDARTRLIDIIGTWAFDPHSLADDDVFACVSLIFDVLFAVDGMREDIDVEPAQLRPFLLAIRSIYSEQNTYHNYQHALDVLQAMYVFLVEAGCIPPISVLKDPNAPLWRRNPRHPGEIHHLLSNVDVFTVCVAAIGHDVGHPGLNNAFMKNACTPLSHIYNHTSALERMHCHLLLSLMRRHGLGHLISSDSLVLDQPESSSSSSAPNSPLLRSFQSIPSQPNIRHLLVETVLATDMSIHGAWMGKFEEWSKYMATLGPGTEPDAVVAERKLEEGRLLVCQALLKCADISNPTRPHGISELWSTALLSEWSAQASLERSLALPISVPANPKERPKPPPPLINIAPSSYRHHRPSPASPPSPTPSSAYRAQLEQYELDAARDQAKGQLAFIDWFAAPLFGLVGRFAPELEQFHKRCKENRTLWSDRLDTMVAKTPVIEDEVMQTPEPDAEPVEEIEVDCEADTTSTPPLSIGAFSTSSLSAASSDSSEDGEGSTYSLAASTGVSAPTPTRDSYTTELPSSSSSPSTSWKLVARPGLGVDTSRAWRRSDPSVSDELRRSPSPWTTTSDVSATSTLGPLPGDDWRPSKARADEREARGVITPLFSARSSGQGVGMSLEAMRAAYRASGRKRSDANGDLDFDPRMARRSSLGWTTRRMPPEISMR